MSAVERPTDGPDTELAAIVADLDDLHTEAASVAMRSEGSVTASAEEVRDDVASIRDRLRAVLARPTAGRDLTAQDVRSVLEAVGGSGPRQVIADRLNAVARPAVAHMAAGEDDAEVWIPPADDCMNHQHEPCPHCASRVFHHRTGRCGSCGRRPAPAVAAAPADDTAAPDGPPTTITVTLPAAEHDIDGEDAHGRWTQNPAWETSGIDRGVISAWAQGVCIEDVLHDEGDVIELEETARKVLAAVEQHRHLARRLAVEGSDS